MRTLVGFDMDGVILDSDRPGDTWFRDSFVRTLTDFDLAPTEENTRALYISSMRDNSTVLANRVNANFIISLTALLVGIIAVALATMGL